MQGQEQHHISDGWVEAAQESSVLQLLVDALKTGVEGLREVEFVIQIQIFLQ